MADITVLVLLAVMLGATLAFSQAPDNSNDAEMADSKLQQDGTTDAAQVSQKLEELRASSQRSIDRARLARTREVLCRDWASPEFPELDPVEGVHYRVLEKPIPRNLKPYMNEVAEFFLYGSEPSMIFSQCFLEPWLNDVRTNVEHVRFPFVFNAYTRRQAEAYYTSAEFDLPDQAHTDFYVAAVFGDNRLDTLAAVTSVFSNERWHTDISETDIETAYRSFAVAHKARVAAEFTKIAAISHVPAIVLNGKFVIDLRANDKEYYRSVMATLDALVAKFVAESPVKYTELPF